MKILLYGGSFDPPHNGHLNNLRAAADRVHPDKIVVMPAGTSPFKEGTNASGALRLEMCRCFAALAQEEVYKRQRLHTVCRALFSVVTVRCPLPDHRWSQRRKGRYRR